MRSIAHVAVLPLIKRSVLITVAVVSVAGLTGCDGSNAATASQITRDAAVQTLDFARFVLNAASKCKLIDTSSRRMPRASALAAQVECDGATGKRTEVNTQVVGVDCEIDELAKSRFRCSLRMSHGEPVGDGSIDLGAVETTGRCARFGPGQVALVIDSGQFSDRQAMLAKTAWMTRRASHCGEFWS